MDIDNDTLIKKITKLSHSLQAEGRGVLDSTNLIELLKPYGEIEFGGSYIYGTMVDRDIDLNVLIDGAAITAELGPKLQNELMSKIKGCIKVYCSDRKHEPKPGRPNGIWLGPQVEYRGNVWNFDIWLLPDDAPELYTNIPLHSHMLKISNEQRNVILLMKYVRVISNTKDKGITSVQIYKQVLNIK